MTPDYLLTMLKKSEHVTLTDYALDRIFKSPKRVDLFQSMAYALVGKEPIKTQKQEIDEWCDKHKVKYWQYSTSLEHHFKLLK